LFDLGGVLVPDPWETYFLCPDIGLADQLRLDRNLVMTAALKLWRELSLRPSSEDEYWSAIEATLGTVIPRRLIAELSERAFEPNPDAFLVLESLHEHDVTLGVISDNTSFWYPKQRDALGLTRYVSDDLVFLSYEYGVNKSQPLENLFAVAAQRIEPASTLVIDDRAKNLQQARSLGFRSQHYSMDDTPVEMRALIEKHRQMKPLL
jgi:FMN phosphatase YigB (HAD superfamily)